MGGLPERRRRAARSHFVDRPTPSPQSPESIRVLLHLAGRIQPVRSNKPAEETLVPAVEAPMPLRNGGFKAALEVRDDVARLFESYRKPEQISVNPRGFLCFGRHSAMGHGCRFADQAGETAKR